MQITKDRWELLLHITRESLFDCTLGYQENITSSEVNLIINTLKNNTPFEVIDCLCGEGEDEKY